MEKSISPICLAADVIRRFFVIERFPASYPLVHSNRTRKDTNLMEKMDQTNHTREEAVLRAVAYHATQSHEASEEYLLPDYMPAVRRVISVQATVLPETRFLNGKALEFGGTLAYSILYIGDGGEIYCAPLTSEYSASVSLGENAAVDAAAFGIDTTVETVSCRVTAPRRMTVKCRLRSQITYLHPRSVADKLQESAGARLTTADELAVERLIEEADDTVLSRGELTASVGGTLSDAGKVIACRGAVRVEETTAEEGCVKVRGDVLLHVIFLSPDGKYVASEAKAPFSESVTVPGAVLGSPSRAWGRAASVSVTPGEEGCTWEIEFDLEAECAQPCKCAYTADLFSTDCASETVTAETDSLCLLRCGQGALTVSGEGGRQSKALPEETVLDAYASCAAERLEVQKGKLCLTGTCTVTTLILQDGDIVSEETVLPLKYEWDVPASPDGGELLWRCSTDPVSVSVRAEGEKLNIHADAALSICAMQRGRIRFVESAVLNKSARRKSDDGCIRVCYPDAGEPLWEIAKRYGVSRQTIRMENGLPEGETVSDGAPILL